MISSNTPSPTFLNLITDRSYDIEFNGYLSNHVKHAIIALERIDAPETRLQQYWDNYTNLTPYDLKLENVPEKWDDVKPITTETEWYDLRGKKQRWQGMCKYLQHELVSKFDGNVDKLVSYYAPDILPGLPGALTHGIIHLGWALDATTTLSDMDDPWMVIEGLAYLNYCYLSVHPENFVHGAHDDDTPVDTLLRLADIFHVSQDLRKEWIDKVKSKYDKESGFHTELIPAGFQWELSKVLSEQHPIAYEMPDWLDKYETSKLMEQMYKTTILLYLMTLDANDGHGNFLVLHLITSLWGLEHVLTVINSEEQSRLAFKCFYSAMISILSTSGGGFPTRDMIEKTVAKYYYAASPDDDDGETVLVDSCPEEHELHYWPKVVERAIPEEEEHNIKLVYVTRALWRRYGYWTGFRIAGNAFTLTPQIGPSAAASFKA